MAHHNYQFTISYSQIPSPVPMSPFVTNFKTNTPFLLSNDCMEEQYVIFNISFAETM